MSNPKVDIFSDGSVAKQNPGPGGWGAVLINGDRIRAAYGTCGVATNNYMEAYAVLMAIQLLRKPCRVHVHTDSNYVVHGLRALRYGRTLETNQAVWRSIRQAIKDHNVTVGHVDGHSTVLYNELADALASWGSKNRREGSFYVHELEETSTEADLVRKIQKRVQLRQARAEAGLAGMA